MSNKHVNHQHGLHTMNATRPKSSLRKRANKAKAKDRKAPLLAALMEARYGQKTAKVKAAPKVRKDSKKVTTAKAAKATKGKKPAKAKAKAE
jgi:hypothetical protein